MLRGLGLVHGSVLVFDLEIGLGGQDSCLIFVVCGLG